MTEGRRSAALVFNPVAGTGAVALEELRERLEEHFDLVVFETSPGAGGEDCARRAIAARPDLIIAAGGDGTVSSVAGALVGTAIPLGIFARGTANSIAGGLGIPTDVGGALQALLEGTPRRVDTARANGKAMLLHASLGFHALTVTHTPTEAKNRWGVLAYLKEGLSNLTTMEPFHVRLETESEVIEGHATNVTIANVAPWKTILAQGPAVLQPDDGALDITIVTATGLAEAVVTGLHLLRTALMEEPATRENIGFLSARTVSVDAKPAQPLLIDGEDAGRGPLRVTCVPRSLDIMVPRPTT